MSVNQSQLLDIATDWSLDANELKAAIGRAIIAIDDATQTHECQSNGDLEHNLIEVAKQLFELIEEDS